MMSGYRRGAAGFVLIEALVAVLIVALGILALTRLEALMIASAGDARARSQAVTLARAKTDELRAAIIRSQYNTAVNVADHSDQVTVGPNTFTRNWDVTQDATLQQRLVKVYVTWTNAAGNTLRVDLNTLIAWDDTVAEVKLTTSTGQNLITPTGSAKRGGGRYTGGGVTVGTTPAGTTQLIDAATNKVILYLDPGVNGAQQFTTISGRVYFDQTGSANAVPTSDNVRVRLSSEGECIYDNTALEVLDTQYHYFNYTCYVGPGWYGNIAVAIDDDVNGGASAPTICVGDPFFNNGTTNGTSYSAHPIPSSLRSYRGYYYNDATHMYLTRGAWGGTAYSPSGYPRPSDVSSFYQTSIPEGQDYFNHHFLIAKNNTSCKAKMELGGSGSNPGETFKRNAGKYYCLRPILENPNTGTQGNGACPYVWPGYEAEVLPGGNINWLLTVNKNEPGTATAGTVTSSPAGIACGSDCAANFATNTSVTLNATPVSGSSFTGWSGACTGTGSCILAMNQRRDVTANFAVGTTLYNLSVVKLGSGTGTVTSNPAGIDCGSFCSSGFVPNAQVTLTVAGSPGTFVGWGGACSGTDPCTVTMDAAKTVTATFQQSAPGSYTLTVTKTGTGTGTVSDSGGTIINCGITCGPVSVNAGSTVNLLAVEGANSVFAGWSGACTGMLSSCVVTMSSNQIVNAQFSPNTCNTRVIGSAIDKSGTVTVDSPSGAGTCSMEKGTANFSCTITAAPNVTIRLRNQRTTGSQAQQYNETATVPRNCEENVDFKFR